MNRALRFIGILTAAVLGAVPSLAQDDIDVSARVSSEQVFVGDSIDLEIVVDGSMDARPPELGGLDGFNAEYQGDENRSMTSMTNINGRQSRNQTIEYVFKYALTPTRSGQLQVPPVTVMVGGKPYTTQPVWIEALPPQSSDDFILEVRAAKTRLYVGEPVMLTFTWYIGGSVSSLGFSAPDSQGAYELSSPPDPRAAQPGANPREFFDFTFLDNPSVGQRGEGRHAGRAFQTLKFEQVFIPRQAGSIRFGPVNLAFGQVVGQGRDIFGRVQSQRMVIASEPIDFDVTELPAAGRPSDFSGLVGNYSLRASATPTSASVGDPIALTVRIRGPEPTSGIEAPDLSSQEGFAGAFKLASEGWTEAKQAAPGERVFATTIRAMDAAVKVIPPIALPYFDPDAGEYRAAKSLPIPVSIAPTTEVTADDAVVAQAPTEPKGPRLATLERAPLGDGPAGIVEGERGLDLLSVQEPDAIAWATGPVGITVLAGPVLAFVGVAVWGPARRAWAEPRRRAMAAAEAAVRKAGRTENPTDAIGAAVRGYIGRMSGRPPETLTARDCAALIAERAPLEAAGIGALLEECEGARYGRREVDPATLGRHAIESLRRLDAEMGRRA